MNVISINNKNIYDIINNNTCIEEDNIIVDSLNLSNRLFLIYNNYLKSSTSFKIFFSTDGFTQLEATLNSFKIKKKCHKCVAYFKQNDFIKSCYICFNLFHLKCADDIKSIKKWSCGCQ